MYSPATENAVLVIAMEDERDGSYGHGCMLVSCTVKKDGKQRWSLL